MTTTTTTTEAAVTGAHEAAKAGMPQLEFSHFPNQIFWLVVTLLVIFFVLKLVALPRIGGTLATLIWSWLAMVRAEAKRDAGRKS